MKKAELVVPVLPVLIVLALACGGAYMLIDSSEPAHIQAVKSTSSYQDLAEQNDPTIKTAIITEEVVSYSQNNDFPYNFSDTNSNRNTFVLAVDFGNFKEQTGKMVLTNISRQGRMYQLNTENEIIADNDASAVIDAYRERLRESRDSRQ